MKKIIGTVAMFAILVSLFTVVCYGAAESDYEMLYLQYVEENAKSDGVGGLNIPANGAMLVDINEDGIPEMFSVTRFDKYYDENGDIIGDAKVGEETYTYKDTHYEIQGYFSVIDGKVREDKTLSSAGIPMPYIMGEPDDEDLLTEEYIGLCVNSRNQHCLAMYSSTFGDMVMSEITYDEKDGFDCNYGNMEVFDYGIKKAPCAYVEFPDGIYTGKEKKYEAVKRLIADYKTKVTIRNSEEDIICSEWAESEIEEANSLGLIPEKMLDDNLTEKVTRAEFAAIAVNLYETLTGTVLETNIEKYDIRYFRALKTDFDNSEYYSEIMKAMGNEISLGTATDSSEYDIQFSPDLTISREQLATMFYRTIEIYGEFEGNKEELMNIPLEYQFLFEDEMEISDYACIPVHYMHYKEIIKGVDEFNFAPQGTATKEQAILLAVRAYNKFNQLRP